MRTKYNTLQIMRPVVETRPLRSFLNVADQLARRIMSQEDFILIDRDLIGDQADEYESTQTAEPLGLHTMYNSTLRLPLFERQAPSEYRGRSLLTAYDAFSRTPRQSRQRAPLPMPQLELRQAALRHDVPPESNITLPFTGITLVNSPGHEEKGPEVALVPGNGRERLLVHDEAAIIFRAIVRYNQSMGWLAPKTVPAVPFMRIPSNVTDEQLTVFSDKLSEHLPLTLELGPIEAKFDN
jgi:hypothetical protein